LVAGDGKFHIWDAYWREDRLYALGADLDPEIANTLERYWAAFVRRLSSGAAVLDVGCGNGAAALALLRAARALGGTLAISGIDEAAIDPPQCVPEHAVDLRDIRFHPRTKMEKLPFEDAAFDAVVSQYGFEFGNAAQALGEAARVLKARGTISFLALPAHSDIVKASKKALKQARYLLRDSALFAEAVRIMKSYYEGPADTRDERIRSELERFNAQVEKAVQSFDVGEVEVVFAIVMGLNKVFVDRKDKTIEEQVMAIEKVRTGLAQYAARAQATVKAALSDSNLETMKRAITTAGFKLTESRTLLVGKHGTIAWQLTGERLVH